MKDCRDGIRALEHGDVNQLEAQYGTESTGRHFVLWSGGCDSTLLLYELLDLYGGENVVSVSYKYPWLLQEKYETEKLHREAFKAKVKIRGHKFNGFDHLELSVDTNYISSSKLAQVNRGGTPQAIAWILSVPLYCKSGDTVYTGAIKGDDLPLLLPEYQAIFNNTSRILERDLTLRLPYLQLTKADIIEKLFRYDLYEETWFCELPDEINKQCHKCTPCKTHQSALNSLLMNDDEFISLKAKKELDKIKKAIKKDKSNFTGDGYVMKAK